MFERWSSPRMTCGDLRVEVVDRDREVVEDGPVRAGDHGVVEVDVAERRVAADEVVDDGLALVGHAQAHRALGLGLAAEAAVGAVLGLARPDVLAGRVRAVGAALVEQPLEDLLVAVGAADLRDRALVPVELEPAQRVEDLLDVLGGRPLAVGIFDAQDEGPAGVPREEPVVERGPRAADVQRAGRRGSEANPHGLGTVPRTAGRPRPEAPHADRRPRLPRRRPGERDRARRASRAAARSRSSTRARAQWKPTVYSDEQVAAYHEAQRGSRVDALLIHAVYLLNAGDDRQGDARARRATSLIASLQAGDALGAHARRPPRRLGEDRHASSRRSSAPGRSSREALSESDGCPLHLENTAGAGGTLGRSFDELAALLDAAGGDERLGVCLDSCHLLASGFEIRTAEALGGGARRLRRRSSASSGVGSLHLNDSQTPLGLQPRPPRRRRPRASSAPRAARCSSPSRASTGCRA